MSAGWEPCKVDKTLPRRELEALGWRWLSNVQMQPSKTFMTNVSPVQVLSLPYVTDLGMPVMRIENGRSYSRAIVSKILRDTKVPRTGMKILTLYLVAVRSTTSAGALPFTAPEVVSHCLTLRRMSCSNSRASFGFQSLKSAKILALATIRGQDEEPSSA